MSYVETLLIETLASEVSAKEVFSSSCAGLYVDGVLNANRLDSMEEAERRWAPRPTGVRESPQPQSPPRMTTTDSRLTGRALLWD